MITWLSSYPKSGNTWIRSIISALLYTNDGIFNLELLKKVKQFPNKRNFEGLTNKFTNIYELKKHWLEAQRRINLDGKVKFLKHIIYYVKLKMIDLLIEKTPKQQFILLEIQEIL